MSEKAERQDREEHDISKPFFHFETAESVFLEEIRSNNPGEALRIAERVNSILALTLEQTRKLQDMIRHFRSLEPRREPSIFESAGGSAHDSVYQVLRAMQYEFPMEKVTILKILPHDLLPLPIPREDLEWMLFHLLYNAREAVGGSAGIITLEAAERETISSETSCASRFLVRVSDTGPGIPQEYLEHLFDPFFMTEHVSRIHGIGLCMVKKMTEFYRGMIRVETSLMGSSYILEFPRMSRE